MKPPFGACWNLPHPLNWFEFTIGEPISALPTWEERFGDLASESGLNGVLVEQYRRPEGLPRQNSIVAQILQTSMVDGLGSAAECVSHTPSFRLHRLDSLHDEKATGA